MVTAVSSNTANKLSSPLASLNSQQAKPSTTANSNESATSNSTSSQSVSSNQRAEAQAAAKAASTNASATRKVERSNDVTQVTISQQQPEPSTTNRNAKPVDQYKAVSSLRT